MDIILHISTQTYMEVDVQQSAASVAGLMTGLYQPSSSPVDPETANNEPMEWAHTS